jgi:hypothetical protein
MRSNGKRLLKRFAIGAGSVITLYVAWCVLLWFVATPMYRVALPSSAPMNEKVAIAASREALRLARKDISQFTPLPAKGSNVFVRTGSNSGFVIWMGTNDSFTVSLNQDGSNALCILSTLQK